MPLPGVPELLMNLSKNTSPNVHLAIASSARRGLFDVKTRHLPKVFSAIPEERRVLGNDPTMSTKRSKPAPDIFLLALERINDTLPTVEDPVTPAQCLVFEDSTAGVEAGRRAGMRVAWVPHPELLNLYRGREEVVLSGNTALADQIAANGIGADAVAELKEVKSKPVNDSRLISEDGWAELLTSLEDFPYSRYGLNLQEPASHADLER
jgi:pseudouridine 5'-phosphatase